LLLEELTALMLPDETCARKTKLFTAFNVVPFSPALLAGAVLYFLLTRLPSCPGGLPCGMESPGRRHLAALFSRSWPVAMTMALLWKIKKSFFSKPDHPRP